MTPEERRELADRLDRAAARNERTAKEMGGLGRGWANAAAFATDQIEPKGDDR